MSLLHIILLLTAASSGMSEGVWDRTHSELEIIPGSAIAEAMLEAPWTP